jgi:hypothetical protein
MKIRIEIPDDDVNYVAESEYDCCTEWQEHLYKTAFSHFKEYGGKVISMGKSYAIREDA